MDFFGDATNFPISLAVAGLALVWRDRAALLLKGLTLVLEGLGSSAYAVSELGGPEFALALLSILLWRMART